MKRSLRLALEVVPWIMFVFCAVSYLISPQYFAEHVIAKDSVEGSGVVESLTVVVLVVGILFGIFSLLRYWHKIPGLPLRAGLILWNLACIYFAGEEISWGQWYFNWSTPDAFADINKQNETNLHNTSSWLNEKPRTVVELWFLFAGLFVGVARLRGKFRYPASNWREWINPYSIGISSCLVFLLSKASEFGSSAFAIAISNSEIRELVIAYFLAHYLISVWMKLRARPEPSVAKVRAYGNDSSDGLLLSPTMKGRVAGE